tara:strand:+ start:1690 stop:2346 length:657 start_codon:yes stop_codon:yes gene_type:complete
VKNYSIIIPIYNERTSIPSLLDKLYPYAKNNQEIIIIDDGSTDGTNVILNKCDFIISIKNDINTGKGSAIRKGLQIASNDKIILFDGDMELDPDTINLFMILNNKIRNVSGIRYDRFHPYRSVWDFGNYFFSHLFNTKHETKIYDVLCCAKAFYKSDIDISRLKSNRFDIDIELLTALIKNNSIIYTILLPYQRRKKIYGKKINLWDGWDIIKRIYSQ